MAAITTSEFSRTAPRGAVVAAEVFAWFLDGLRTLARQARPAANDEATRVMPAGSFPA